MQAAEGLVALAYLPLLAVELDFDDVISICSMVSFVLDHASARDLNLKRYLEEKTSLTCTVLRTLLHMVNKCLAREEDAAELALHAERVLEHSLVNLHRVDLLSELSVSLLNIRDSLAQILVRPRQLLALLRLSHIALILLLQLLLLLGGLNCRLLLLLLDRLHQLLLHLLDILLLELLTLKHFIAHLLLVFFIGLSVHICEDLLVLGLDLELILSRQLCYLHSLLLVEFVDYGLLLLLDEHAQLFLLRGHLLELLLQLDDLCFAQLQLCLSLGQVTFEIADLLHLERIIPFLRLLEIGQFVFSYLSSLKRHIASLC